MSICGLIILLPLRCFAWFEGPNCDKRMRIPYRPLSERMLKEPFWLGLIAVFVVLAVIGLVWCAKRHFPEKIEKLLQEEADRNRREFIKWVMKLWFEDLFMNSCQLTSSPSHIVERTASSSWCSEQSVDADRNVAICRYNAWNSKINIQSIGYKKTFYFEPQQPSTSPRFNSPNLFFRRSLAASSPT